jgi:hypothetical protein
MYMSVHYPCLPWFWQEPDLLVTVIGTHANLFLSSAPINQSTVMAEENQQPPETGGQPSQSTASAPEGQNRPQGRQNQGQRRNDRRDRPRHHGPRRDHQRRDQQPPQPAQAKPSQPKDADAENDEDEETEQDRSSQQNRHHRRGGRPPKKMIEEWVNDPYCE